MKNEFFENLQKLSSKEKKNRETTNRINKEYFFFNPAYQALLDKRSNLINRKTFGKKETKLKLSKILEIEQAIVNDKREFIFGMPSLSMTIKYKKT